MDLDKRERIPRARKLRSALVVALAASGCVRPPQAAPDPVAQDAAPEIIVALEPGRSADGDLIPIAPGIAGYRLRKGETRAQAQARLRARAGIAAVEENARVRVPEAPRPVGAQDAYRIQAVLPLGEAAKPATPGATAGGFVPVVGGSGGPAPSPTPGGTVPFVGGSGPAPSPTPGGFVPIVGGNRGPVPSPTPTLGGFVPLVGGNPGPAPSPTPGGLVAIGGLPFLGFSPPVINDPLYRLQWFLPRIGIPEAWQVPAGRAFGPVTVAVLDSGVDNTHPDLVGRAVLGPTLIPGTTTAMDDFGHGTNVAGIIGARSGNGVGVAAVAPEVKILAIKVLDSNGSGTIGEVIAGLEAARAAGARVINMSFGTAKRSALLDQAIARVLAAGIIVVASAGNEGIDGALYPAATEGVIAVGAVDQDDTRASFSTGGPHVRLAAPGVDIVSVGRGGKYSVASGTSQAAPVVAGAIATLLAFQPALGSAAAADLLFETGRPTGGFTAATVRRLDLTRALARLP